MYLLSPVQDGKYSNYMDYLKYIKFIPGNFEHSTDKY